TLSYTLSLHDALPILFQRGPEDLQLDAQGAVHGRGAHDVALHPVPVAGEREGVGVDAAGAVDERVAGPDGTGLQETAHRSQGRVDRKSTRLNSSHVKISYAVFCLKKKKREASIA